MARQSASCYHTQRVAHLKIENNQEQTCLGQEEESKVDRQQKIRIYWSEDAKFERKTIDQLSLGSRATL